MFFESLNRIIQLVINGCRADARSKRGETEHMSYVSLLVSHAHLLYVYMPAF